MRTDLEIRTMTHLAQNANVALLFVFSLVLPSSVMGQPDSVPQEALSYKIGETDVYPTVKLGFFQNDNVFLTQESEVAGDELQISPNITWFADRRLLSLEGSYLGLYGVNSEEVLNYADHRLSAKAEAELTSRKRLSGQMSLDFGHEDEGTNLTTGSGGTASEQVKFSNFELSGVYRYGANRAKGNLAGGIFLQHFDYSNRSDITNGSGYTLIEPFGEFSLRLSGDTRLLSEIRLGVHRFEDSSRDRNDVSLLGGVQFAATGKSGGEGRIGFVNSQPTFSGNDSQTELVFRASFFWEPTSFARLELDGKRAFNNLGGSLVNEGRVTAVEDLIELRWKHRWSSRVSHQALLQSRNSTQVCPDLDFNNLMANLEINVRIRRWLSVGVSGSSAVREVPSCSQGLEVVDPNLDFQRTRFGVHFRATL